MILNYYEKETRTAMVIAYVIALILMTTLMCFSVGLVKGLSLRGLVVDGALALPLATPAWIKIDSYFKQKTWKWLEENDPEEAEYQLERWKYRVWCEIHDNNR